MATIKSHEISEISLKLAIMDGATIAERLKNPIKIRKRYVSISMVKTASRIIEEILSGDLKLKRSFDQISDEHRKLAPYFMCEDVLRLISERMKIPNST